MHVCACVYVCLCQYVQRCVHVVVFVGVSVQECRYVSVWLNEIPDGYTGQADVSLRGPAEVDGVAVQTDVLQCVPDVVEIFQVAERVLVHHLNIVTLRQRREEDT